MKKYIKRLLVITIEVAGCFLALYLGGYWFFIRPVRLLFLGFMSNTLTARMIVVCILKIFFSTTVIGGVWCIFDIIAGKFRDE